MKIALITAMTIVVIAILFSPLPTNQKGPAIGFGMLIFFGLMFSED